jgi:hypothetical protein
VRTEQTYYGDYRVFDEMPFGTADLTKAVFRISADFKENVFRWPVTIDFNEKTGYWEVWFTRPVSDEDYINRIGLQD